MAYIVSSTEKVRGKGADYETKAMLYLMGGREDSFEIYSLSCTPFEGQKSLIYNQNIRT